MEEEENISGRQHCKEGGFLVYLETVQLFTATVKLTFDCLAVAGTTVSTRHVL